MRSIITSTDSYKMSHFIQYPPGTRHVSSYIEARAGSDHEQVTQFFGLQAFIREYLETPITRANIGEGHMTEGHGVPYNDSDWDYIRTEHGGYLPIEIQALPEGMIVPRGTPMVQVRNTDPRLPWLTSYVETSLLRAIWYPSSVATLSFLTKAIIYDALVKSSDDPEGQLPFKLHDFGARGASSGETAMLGGMAHLINFKGTDTLEALQGAFHYYDADDVVGYSIPASEHSTMTAWGRKGEKNAYGNMIDEFGHGLFSVVSDSYDLWNAVDYIFPTELREKIDAMDGTLVVRPDSGDPILTPLKVVERLWESFGGFTNSKGFKVLDPKIRVIQGDGMNAHKIGVLCGEMLKKGFSLDNIAFGMGGGLLQGHMRDDMRFAMKANAIDFGEGWQDIQKMPATDPSKASKAGRQAVVEVGGKLIAVREDKLRHLSGEVNLLEPVYRNGKILREETFDCIRARAHKEMLRFHARVFEPEQVMAAE